MGDHVFVSELALKLLQQAQEHHRTDQSREPISLTLDLAQKSLAEWLATTLEQGDTPPSHVLATGYIALLLSQALTAPRRGRSWPIRCRRICARRCAKR